MTVTWQGPATSTRSRKAWAAGDKGDTSNISVIAYDPTDYARIQRQVTAERVKEHFTALVTGEVTRYELPNISALRGGVTRSFALDAHGKCLGSAILDLEIEN